ncbi:DUF4150 domain-containing protein [Photobacterium sp. WH77]|uniref:PAAR-like domain-containing protein n=1 Tax=unclassified Photobacterium TaxID=2628852 RepID=UPI001EDA6547|nr:MULTISPECIES: PAAR-like domain-containing protein [unclassified Photobacterium]MCG2839304.1 DUF4150 domain-containing protein [Photobacterium sp. WH77]MCG2846921.1 DUF4150 domain-containing protein [Photobacterium sp. WH80]
MGVTISADGLSIVHKGSGGEANAAVPDVCMTTVGPPVVPIPYGNNAKSADLADGSTTVTADGGNSIALKSSQFSCSTGDAGGDKKGIVSGTTEAEAKFTTASSTVKIEGVGVARKTDMMTMNAGNTMCFGCENPSVTVQPDEDKTHALRVQCRYTSGKPLANAPFKLKDESGAVLAEGTLNNAGEAIVDGLPTKGCTVEYGEAPAPYKINYPRPANPDKATLDDEVFFDRASHMCVPFWVPRGDMQKRIWGYLGETLADSLEFRHMLEVEIRAHLPLNPKPGQAEEIAARLINFFDQQPVSEQDILGLISTMLPILEADGVLFDLFVNYHKEESGNNLLASMRHLGTGNPSEWLGNLDWDAKATLLSRECGSILEKTDARLEAILFHSDTRGYTYISDNIKAHRESVKAVRKNLPDDISAAMSGLKQKIASIRSKGENIMVVPTNNQRTTQGGSITDVVHSLNALPAPLAIRLTYDDMEQTPAGYVPYSVMFANGEKQEGKLDANGSVMLYGVPQVGAEVTFGDKEAAKKAEKELEKHREAIPEALNGLVGDMVQTARQQAATAPMIAAEQFAELKASVEAELAEMRSRKDAFDDLSFLEQSWSYAKSTGMGISSGVTDYLPDFGEFGELMDEADIGIDLLVKAIVDGDIDVMQRKLQEVDRVKLGLQEASQAMEILLLLVVDPETRSYLASLPRLFLEAMPADELTRLAVSQGTQKGIDFAAVTGGTALAGAVSGGVGAPVAAIAITGGVTARNGGKALEGLIDVLMKISDSKKTTLNRHEKKQHEKDNETNLPKECPICDDPKCKNRNRLKPGKGNNGDGAHREKLQRQYRNQGKEYPKDHPWQYDDQLVLLDIHHVIPKEAVKGMQFKRLFDDFSYDINEVHNLISLPSDMNLACELAVQRHKGKHSLGLALRNDQTAFSILIDHENNNRIEKIKKFNSNLKKKNNDLAYPKASKNLVLDVKRNMEHGEFCKHAGNQKKMNAMFERDMKRVSKDILSFIQEFTWTIAWDSRDYTPESKKGCCNVSSIQSKRKGNQRGVDCQLNRDHGLGYGTLKNKLYLGQ